MIHDNAWPRNALKQNPGLFERHLVQDLYKEVSQLHTLYNPEGCRAIRMFVPDFSFEIEAGTTDQLTAAVTVAVQPLSTSNNRIQ